MPKAKSKAKKKSKKTAAKRTVTCGKCKEPGHNSRSCTGARKITSSKDIPPPPIKPGTKTRLTKPDLVEPAKRMSTVPKRDAPTADTSGSQAAPYRCVTCNAVAILVIVRVKDYDASFKKKKEIFKGEMRCEKCMNKPIPSDLILKWGAAPGEVVEIPEDDA